MLEVYSDALQTAGDPRGELIALELHLERQGEALESDPGWQQAMTAWLGETWTHSALAPWPPRSFRHGLLDDLRIQPRGDLRAAEVCRAALRSPAGAFLRGATISDGPGGIRESLDALAGGVHPWLDRLTIVQDSPRGAAPVALAGILGAAVPNLREVAVGGQRAAAAPLPASVQKLVIGGAHALDIVDAGSSNVREVELKILAVGPSAISAIAERLAPARFPLLEALDLSRCAHNPFLMYAHDDALRIVQVMDAPERLRRVRIATPTRENAQRILGEVRKQLPALAIEIVE